MFTDEGFMPRWQCGEWSLELMSVYITANIFIFLGYIILPMMLIHKMNKKIWSRSHKILLGFWALFILSCGLGHLLDGVVSFIWPNYRLFALFHTITAITICITVTLTAMHFKAEAKNPSEQAVSIIENIISDWEKNKKSDIMFINLKERINKIHKVLESTVKQSGQ